MLAAALVGVSPVGCAEPRQMGMLSVNDAGLCNRIIIAGQIQASANATSDLQQQRCTNSSRPESGRGVDSGGS